MCACGCGCDCGCVSIAYQNHIRRLPFVFFLCMKGGFESIKLFSYSSLCRCFKAHTILTSIMICLCFEGCGGDAFPHIAKKTQSSGCFFKRDFGESSLLKLRNFKTSIRICLCFASCGGDSFHKIAKQIPVKRVRLQAGLRRMGPRDAEKVQNR